MSDTLFELLTPYLDAQVAGLAPIPTQGDQISTVYLSRLTTLPLSSLTSTEAQSLTQTSQSILRSLQALSKRSHKSIISSADHLSSLRDALPALSLNTGNLEDGLPELESEAARFADKYSKAVENPVLDRRRKAMLLARNVDRVADVLDLPTLLSSAISTSSSSGQAGGATNANSSYASALDLYAHIKRLNSLYPNLAMIRDISAQAEQEMKSMTSNLIASLQGQGIKLAAAMRNIGWLRRVAPELDDAYNRQQSASFGTSEGALGTIFLVCRLSNLLGMLEALEPLQELADQETRRRESEDSSRRKANADQWSGGQQTERYLKRYIEIFREQSFAIISMYKSIFPSALTGPGNIPEKDPRQESAGLCQPTESIQFHPVPSALATFPSHLVELLFDTLQEYLPNVQDKVSRDSLLTQVLYCAGSLGRLGGDFSMMLALLDDLHDENQSGNDEDSSEDEWAEVMKKHRVQASRLELLASGVGTRSSSSPAREPSPSQTAVR